MPFDSVFRNHKFFEKGECSQDASVTTSELQEVLSSVKTGMADYSVSNLILIWVAGLAVAVSPCIAWFAFRWLKRTISKALFKGKL